VSNLARSGPESNICHERYTNEDYYIFNKNTQEKPPERPKKREAKSPRRQADNIKDFEDLVKECEEQSEEPPDLTEIKDYITLRKHNGRGPSMLRRVSKKE